MDNKAGGVLKCAAIVVAGGSGQRMGSEVPKQFLRIAGKPIMWWTLKSMSESGLFEETVLVLPKGWLSRVEELLEGLTLEARVAEGGLRRQESVFNGISETDDDTDLVLIHDAVRPFVRRQTLSDVLEAAAIHGAATAAVPARDTLGSSADGAFIDGIPDRSKMWRIQTPQAFRREVLMRAHAEGQKACSYATDDCALALAVGVRPAIVHGSEENIKITSPLDLVIAEHMAQEGNREA